jgi:hypothetical protein
MELGQVAQPYRFEPYHHPTLVLVIISPVKVPPMSNPQQSRIVPKSLRSLGKHFKKLTVGSSSNWFGQLIEEIRNVIASTEPTHSSHIKDASENVS